MLWIRIGKKTAQFSRIRIRNSALIWLRPQVVYLICLDSLLFFFGSGSGSGFFPLVNILIRCEVVTGCTYIINHLIPVTSNNLQLLWIEKIYFISKTFMLGYLQFYSGCSVPAALSRLPILDIWSRLTCLCCPVPAVLSLLSCPCCPVPAVLCRLSCAGCSILPP